MKLEYLREFTNLLDAEIQRNQQMYAIEKKKKLLIVMVLTKCVSVFDYSFEIKNFREINLFSKES